MLVLDSRQINFLCIELRLLLLGLLGRNVGLRGGGRVVPIVVRVVLFVILCRWIFDES